MLSGIIGLILGVAGIAGYMYITSLRPGPQPAVNLVDFSKGPPDPEIEVRLDDVVSLKPRQHGDLLLTPMGSDYMAVIVQSRVDDSNFYVVRLVADERKLFHVHGALLFTKDEYDAAHRDKN